MFKQLKIYYLLISLPFVLLLLGSVIFINAIMMTITANPHPQINYTIFIIILVGGTLVLINARRLVREARMLIEYFGALHAKVDWARLQLMANSYSGETACLMQMLSTSGGRTISHQEQVAIEHELSNARAHLMRRNALPQYLSGLLVGMGLLGTFIGLLSTLNDISALITSFADLDMATASPLVVFRQMIERMKAPMQSMGIAFSASMFGLLGSIILGLMMIGLRRLQGDITTLMSSEVSKHIEIALNYEASAASVVPVAGRFVGGSAAAGIESGGEVAKALYRIEERYAESAKALLRIEERYVESARSQQRALTVLVDDLQLHRSDLLQALSSQAEASHGVRIELQQLLRQFGGILGTLERGNGETSTQLSELTVQVTGHARETQKLMGMQLDEQARLRDTLDSFKLEERLGEAARSQQRVLSSALDDLQRQRADMLQALADQSALAGGSRDQLQLLSGQIATLCKTLERGGGLLATQLSELSVNLSADGKESQLLTEQALGDIRRELRALGEQIDTALQEQKA